MRADPGIREITYDRGKAMEEKMEHSIQRLEDESRLRHLIDEVSILADQKDIAQQMTYFTEDAVMITKIGGRTYELTGRKAILQAFSGLVDGFRRSFHMNGQVSLDIGEDTANAVIYCRAMIEREQSMEDEFAVYRDTYEKRDGTWRITRRESEILWIRQV